MFFHEHLHEVRIHVLLQVVQHLGLQLLLGWYTRLPFEVLIVVGLVREVLLKTDRDLGHRQADVVPNILVHVESHFLQARDHGWQIGEAKC
jgi:hypothetical protein